MIIIEEKLQNGAIERTKLRGRIDTLDKLNEKTNKVIEDNINSLTIYVEKEAKRMIEILQTISQLQSDVGTFREARLRYGVDPVFGYGEVTHRIERNLEEIIPTMSDETSKSLTEIRSTLSDINHSLKTMKENIVNEKNEDNPDNQ